MLQCPQGPQLGTAERAHAVDAILEPPHVQQAMRKIDLIPSQCTEVAATAEFKKRRHRL